MGFCTAYSSLGVYLYKIHKQALEGFSRRFVNGVKGMGGGLHDFVVHCTLKCHRHSHPSTMSEI